MSVEIPRVTHFYPVLYKISVKNRGQKIGRFRSKIRGKISAKNISPKFWSKRLVEMFGTNSWSKSGSKSGLKNSVGSNISVKNIGQKVRAKIFLENFGQNAWSKCSVKTLGQKHPVQKRSVKDPGQKVRSKWFTLSTLRRREGRIPLRRTLI